MNDIQLPSLILIAALLLFGAEANAQQVTINDGIFTLEQAQAGETIYARDCAACHGANLGGGEGAGPLIGSAFLDKWSATPLSALYTLTSLTMPVVNPNGLSEQQYHQVLAYILLANGYPAGDRALTGGTLGLTQVELAAPERDAAELLAELGSYSHTDTGLTQEWPHVRGDAGETIWVHRLDEGKRGENAPRGGSGRGLAYTEIDRHSPPLLHHAGISASRFVCSNSTAATELRLFRYGGSKKHCWIRKSTY